MSVLIVDDDEAIAALIAELVATCGGDVWGVAGSGEEAIAVLDVVESGPDLVLLDVHLPGIDGIETARRLLRTCPSMRVVLTSTAELADLPADAMDSGVSEFVPKADLGPQLVGRLLSA